MSQLSPKEMIGMAASIGGGILGAGMGSGAAVATCTKVLSDMGVPAPVIGQVNQYASIFGAAGGAAAGAALGNKISNQICDSLGIT